MANIGLALCRIKASSKAQPTLPLPCMPQGKGKLSLQNKGLITGEFKLKAEAKLLVTTKNLKKVEAGKITAESQKLSPDNLISLFQIDMNRYNLGIGYFTNTLGFDGEPIMFGGNKYYPTPVEITGYARIGDGATPRPKMQIANTNKLITSLLTAGDDLAGCKVTRIRTFKRFLDNGIDPDPHQTLPKEEYYINQKMLQNKSVIEFELCSVFDQQNISLPKRQVVRDYCSFIYRYWNNNKNEWLIDECDPCPYAGDKMFTKNGKNTSSKILDVCGKKLRDCKLRFGAKEVLPTRAFPGVARLQ